MKNIFIVISLVMFSNLACAASPAWNGFYAGLNGGVVFNNVKVNSNQLGFTEMSGTCEVSENYASFFPGVEIGYARQLPSGIVLGAEADYTYNAVNRIKTLRCLCPFNTDVSDQFTFKNTQQASLRARLGYALKRNLQPFVTVGGSFVNESLQYSNEGSDEYSTQRAKLGWLLGAGIEWKFLQKWSLRAEYFYADYGSINLSIPAVYGLYDPAGHGSAKLQANTVRAVINYWIA